MCEDIKPSTYEKRYHLAFGISAFVVPPVIRLVFAFLDSKSGTMISRPGGMGNYVISSTRDINRNTQLTLVALDDKVEFANVVMV